MAIASLVLFLFYIQDSSSADSLKVIIDKKDLPLIYQAGQRVVLIKKVFNGGYKVAWATFEPFETNLVTWDSDYSLYASPTQPVEGINLSGLSITQAQAQNRFIFKSDRTFSAPQSNQMLLPNQYMILNDVPYNQAESLTFGMAQAFQLNNSERQALPLNAALVPAKQFVKFIPEDKVLIFLANNIINGTIHNQVILESDLSKIASKQLVSGSAESVATELDFSTNKKLSVKYYPNQGKFIQQ
ncbi:hypothetical protein [Nostoc sp.]|uniref:hypothetical protein n=1 Tax=Nostoc sp. TaxID=1180 RepID=UPI002FF72C78